MLSAMAPHRREMSQDLRKKIIYLHKKGEGYKKISKALLISQNTVAKVVQTFKKDGTATISQRRPGRPRKLTPRQERLLMRRVEENRHASSHRLNVGLRKRAMRIQDFVKAVTPQSQQTNNASQQRSQKIRQSRAAPVTSRSNDKAGDSLSTTWPLKLKHRRFP